jgi:hypothetical protein
MSLTTTGKIAVGTVVLYMLLGAFSYCFLWDKLPIKRKELTIRFSDEVVCRVYFEWVEGRFFNPPPFQLIKGEIPVFGVMKVKFREE